MLEQICIVRICIKLADSVACIMRAMDSGLVAAMGAGLLGGMVVNYLADVMPEARRLARPGWWPISRGRLAGYFARRRVLWVLTASVGLAIWLSRSAVSGWTQWEMALVLVYLGTVTVIDIEHRAILHPLSAVGALLFGALGWMRHGAMGTLLGGLGGFGVLLGMYWLGARIVARMAKRRGQVLDEGALGFGDVILAGVIGLLLGWPGILGGLFLTVIASGAYSGAFIIWRLLRGQYEAFASVPYGPFLALGAVGVMVLGG